VQASKFASPVYFFVAGPPKGGTTWLMRLIDAHPDAICSGEGHFFDRVRPMFQKVLTEYQRLLDLDNKLVFSGKPVYPALRESDLNSLLRSFVIYRLHLRDPEGRARALGDKTPGNFRDFKAIFSSFPEARLIFINRDPRDSAVSLFGHMRRRISLGLSREEDFDRLKLIHAACSNWRVGNQAATQLRNQRPDRLTMLSYETLSSNTMGEYTRVCEDLGLSTNAEVLEAAIASCDFTQLSGGRQRGERNIDSFYTSGKSGGWRDELSTEEAQLVETLCAESFEAAGYTPS